MRESRTPNFHRFLHRRAVGYRARVLSSIFGIAVAANLVTSVKAQFVQQGDKLVGTGGDGNASQGSSVAVSADGNTVIIGGPSDDTAAGAVWIYTRSGGTWSQQGPKLVGAGAVGYASQGTSVGISADGNTAIVGGPWDNANTGAAWVFTRSGGVWTQQGPKLVGMDNIQSRSVGVLQGHSVALSGDGNTAVIGGPTDNNGIGAAWVFTRSGAAWSQQGPKLVGTDAPHPAQQGFSVAISGDGNRLVVGGFEDRQGVGGTGAAWVFKRSGDTWNQEGGKLVGSGAVAAGTFLGYAVALSGDGNTAIAGGRGGYSGAAWVFTQAGNVWSQQGPKLVGTDATADAQQGSSVGLSWDGNTAIIGGPSDASSTGAAWVYRRQVDVWFQVGKKLVGTGVAGLSHQGVSVALSTDGNTAIVGGSGDNSGVGGTWVFVANPATPQIPAITNVVNGATFSASISPNSWATILGVNLAPAGDVRTWSQAEIVNGNLPVNLDGTSVTANGKPAAVEFISPSQVNVQMPDDTALLPVQVVVTTATGVSNAFSVDYARFAPALFAGSPPYLVAQHADGSYVTSAAPATPGEVIVLWGTGFGAASPPVPSGRLFSGANRLANDVTVAISGQPCLVDFAGVVAAGLVQINVHVPSSINDGDSNVIATVQGASTQPIGNLLPIHR